MSELLQILAVLGAAIAIGGFVAALIANIRYSKPHVEKLQSENVEYGRKIAALEAQNAEQGAQIRVLQHGPMDAIRELAGAVSMMAESVRGDGTAIVEELRLMRKDASDEHDKLIKAVQDMGSARPGR